MNSHAMYWHQWTPMQRTDINELPCDVLTYWHRWGSWPGEGRWRCPDQNRWWLDLWLGCGTCCSTRRSAREMAHSKSKSPSLEWQLKICIKYENTQMVQTELLFKIRQNDGQIFSTFAFFRVTNMQKGNKLHEKMIAFEPFKSNYGFAMQLSML